MFVQHEVEITKELCSLYGKDRAAAFEQVKALFPPGDVYNWEHGYGIYAFVCYYDCGKGKYCARLSVGSSCD